ncbi:MAG: endonuclease/exonuclease/phosphatase family protein [Bacteroidota bacterium]|nr:endonuclease/exonuclease/phosphatase family protein [Bacteroidota bacterium]
MLKITRNLILSASKVYLGFIFFSVLQAQEIRFASWNIEHLAEENGAGCIPRHDSDYVKLKKFALSLNADVMALQEVENIEAVARVFPRNNWNIILSERPASKTYSCRNSGFESTQQRVAIVIRKDLSYTSLGSFEELALNRDGLRYGVQIRIFGEKDSVDVMAVHLKSGCFIDDFSSSERSSCKVLEKQVPVLDKWIETNVLNNRKFILLGDFNHRLANGNNKMWNIFSEINGAPLEIRNSMQNLTGCHPRYPAPIDHILMGPHAYRLKKAGSEAVHYFPHKSKEMSEDDMLSDHCPISVVLKI